MVKVYHDADCSMDLLKGKTVTVIGYESQGHAHTLNLKDNEVNVVVGLRLGFKSRAKAEEAGLMVLDTAGAVEAGDTITILIPDRDQPDIYKEDIEPNLGEENMLMFVHDFSVHFNQIVAPISADAIMYAPESPGHIVCSQYQGGRGVPSLTAVHQDTNGRVHDYALAYAGGIGAGRAGIIETAFKEETGADLFGEQAVLCGGVCELIQVGFDTLVEAGYEPGITYFECVHEMKLIVDLINSGGFAMMRYSISDIAGHDDYVTGKCLATEETRREVKKVLTEIQDGTFAGGWITESKAAGRSHFLAMCRVHTAHPSEKVGEKLCKMMNWLRK